MAENKAAQILYSYLEGLRGCIDEIGKQDIASVADIIYQAYLKGRHIYIFGNGGSASTASHFARDLSIGAAAAGKPRVKAVSLADSMVAITSLANDVNYESVFKEQLVGQIEAGDVAIGISCSGNSPNVLAAIRYARENGAATVGFTGFGGGKLKGMADMSINLSSRDYGQVEDMHLALEHIITQMLREKLAQ
ncbi:MAG: SIS domain-containing protein [Dehalococcoidia bacterium]|nr:MAG: SIS domain-containing protein [Dehalococcoidia bacterium]